MKATVRTTGRALACVADGATLRLNAQPRQQIVVGVRLPASSQLTLHGMEVSYSHGWQRGTQLVRLDVEVNTTQG